MHPRVTSRWETDAVAESQRAAPGAGVELREATAAAQHRVRKALAAVGTDLAGLILDICCFERGLEAIEAERHWPQRSARIVLGIALNTLAQHYGLIIQARPHSGELRHWGDIDFKPTSTAWTNPHPRAE